MKKIIAETKETKTGQPRQLEVINLLRGIAALAVAWFHFTNGNVDFLDPGLLKISGKYGYLGVQVFFVISGFIIPYSLERSQFKMLPHHYKNFLAKRFIRLHPAYLASIALTIFLWYLSTLHPQFQGSPPDIDPINLLLHFGYLNGIFNQPWISPVFWTLGIEFQYYFLILLIWPLVSARGQVTKQIFGYTIIFLVPLAFNNSNLVFHWLNLFGLGIISFQYFFNKVNFQKYCVLLCFMSIFCMSTLGLLFTLTGLLTSVCIVFVRVPKLGAFGLLSDLSYSLYLVHVPIGGRVINIGERLGDSTTILKFIVLLTAVVASLTFAYLMYVFIEKPTQRWSKSIKYN